MSSPVSGNPFRYLLFVTGFFVCVSFSSRAQTVDSIKSKFKAYSERAFQEKVYLHVDKRFYMAGDIIWFKAYVVDGSSHKPADLSKVAYVELLDTLQQPVLQAKIALSQGLGNGSLVLPASMNSGNYKIRAYTSWMKNFSPEYYFEEFVSVVNPAKRLEQNTLARGSESADVQFFPEGGNLVNELKSKVAVKVLGQGNKGLDAWGSIIDQNNDTVASFQTFKYGMGSFYLTPATGKTYRAVVYVNQKKIIRNLPKVHTSGYVMNVSEANSQMLQIKVSSMGNQAAENIHLMVHTRGVIRSALSGVLHNEEIVFTIAKNLLGDGISHLTIFNDAKRPVCERLYFKRPQNKLLIGAAVPADQFAARKKVEIDLSTADQSNKEKAASLSVSVYRLDSLTSFKHTPIAAYLWLTSDLKGHIEDAAAYFDPANRDSDQAFENLMLTQGWRRFNWDEVLTGVTKSFTHLPEHQGHIISGKLSHKENGAAAPAISTYLSIADKRVQFYHDKSGDQGDLLFFTKDFYGRRELILQNNYALDSTYQAEIFSPFSVRYSQQRIPALRLAAANASALAVQNINMQLPYLYSTGSKQLRLPEMDTTAFFGNPNLKYHLDDYTRFTTMEEVLREYVPEAGLQRRQKKTGIRLTYSHKKGLFAQDALLLIDGVPFFDADKIVAFDPLKLESIQIVNHRYLTGDLVSDGIMNFRTYQGDLGGFPLDARALVIDYEGLQLKREFYSPVYQSEEQIASRVPDFRELLYWSSDIQTNPAGKAKFSFYTSDQAGNYVMVIQGISADGHAGTSVGELKVVR